LTEGVGTLSRAELADAIGSKTGISRAKSLDLVDGVLRLMSGALREGENVKISSFGTFMLRDKAERIGRNPKTGLEAPITPRRVLTFRASQLLKEQIAVK
jgi:integration host factor subunit alpha